MSLIACLHANCDRTSSTTLRVRQRATLHWRSAALTGDRRNCWTAPKKGNVSSAQKPSELTFDVKLRTYWTVGHLNPISNSVRYAFTSVGYYSYIILSPVY